MKESSATHRDRQFVLADNQKVLPSAQGISTSPCTGGGIERLIIDV